MRRRWFALVSVVVVSVVVIAVLLVEVSLAANPIEVYTADTTYPDSMTANAAFTGIGDYHIILSEYSNTSNFECALPVGFNLYSGSRLNTGLYTKSITLKLTNSGTSTLAFGVDQYSEPPTQYRVDYGYEPPATKSVTIQIPFASAGASWAFTIYIYNPPTVDGTIRLNLAVGAQVVENHFLGRTYDLQTDLQIPHAS